MGNRKNWIQIWLATGQLQFWIRVPNPLLGRPSTLAVAVEGLLEENIT